MNAAQIAEPVRSGRAQSDGGDVHVEPGCTRHRQAVEQKRPVLGDHVEQAIARASAAALEDAAGVTRAIDAPRPGSSGCSRGRSRCPQLRTRAAANSFGPARR
jgi:hypothetical protein